MQARNVSLAFMIGLTVTGAHASDDQNQCKRAVDSYLQGEAMVSPTSPLSDNSQRKTDLVKQLRAGNIPECDIQRRLVGTAAQSEEKRETQR